MMDELRELYQEVILDHGKNPRNHHALADATHDAVGHNAILLKVFSWRKNAVEMRFEPVP